MPERTAPNQPALEAKLRLRFSKDLSGTDATVPATIRVQSGRKIWKQTAMIPAGQDWLKSLVVSVPAGFYSVAVSSPAGVQVTAEGEIGSGEEKEVILEGRHSRHEWLSWSSYAVDKLFLHADEPSSRSAAPRRSRSGWLGARGETDAVEAFSIEGSDQTQESTASAEATLHDVMGSQGKIRFWQPGKLGAWEACDASVQIENMDQRVAILRLRQNGSSPDSYLLAEVAGDGSQRSEFSMVPWSWTTAQHGDGGVAIIVDALPALSASPSSHKLRVRTTVMDSDFAHLSGYLMQGDITTLETVNELMAPRAEMLFAGKLQQPLLATAAALALLKTRQLTLLHDWTRNLAMWFPHLPDGPIIRAWHLLYDRSSGAGESPRQLLLEATARGLPVFAESLRLLINGLRFFKPSDNEDVAKALAMMEPYLWSADPDEEFTSYRGFVPDAPGSNELPASAPRVDWALQWTN